MTSTELLPIAGATILLLLSVVGFFGARIVRKVDAMDANLQRFMLDQARLHAVQEAMRHEVDRHRRQIHTLEAWRTHLSGFLSRLGFKERPDPSDE